MDSKLYVFMRVISITTGNIVHGLAVAMEMTTTLSIDFSQYIDI
jgi:hypothetical protein